MYQPLVYTVYNNVFTLYIMLLFTSCVLLFTHTRMYTILSLSDPALVGKAFVKQYYTQMHRDPSQMHRFYLEQSSFVHGGSEIGSEEPVIGQKVRVGEGGGREEGRRLRDDTTTCNFCFSLSPLSPFLFPSFSPLLSSLPSPPPSQSINDKILSLDLQQVHAKIKQVDSHITLGNGIVIQVGGVSVWVCV